LAASPPPDWTAQRLDRAAPFLLAVLVGAVFANALNGTFVFDDIGDITANPSAKSESFFARLAVMNRPLTKASYALQDWLHGPWAGGYHAVNVALHMATAVLALALVRRALRLGGLGAVSMPVAFAVVALWAIHPALTETVTYVSGRSMGLSSCLVLGALLAATGSQTTTNRALTFACALLAPLARETALIAPAILIWWQLTLQPSEGRRAALLRLLPVAAGTALAAALILALPRHTDLIADSLRRRPPLDALLGNVHAAADILGFWAMPGRVTIDPKPPLAWPWTDIRTLAKLALFTALVLFALAFRRREGVVAFGIGLALLALAPSNTLLWRADPVALKPLYLGGLGLTLAASAALLRLAGASRAALSFLATAALFGTALLATQTVARNALFADEIALWQDAAAKTPAYGRPSIMLGYALFNAGRYEEAEAALARGCNLDPLDEEAAAALALVRAIRAEIPGA
jgi:tetratricopeptide (TPR) repeat protein